MNGCPGARLVGFQRGFPDDEARSRWLTNMHGHYGDHVPEAGASCERTRLAHCRPYGPTPVESAGI